MINTFFSLKHIYSVRYTIHVLDTYKAALRRVRRLGTAEYAFSTDGELDGQTKASKITESMKKQSTAQLFSLEKMEESLDDGWTPRSEGIIKLFTYHTSK